MITEPTGLSHPTLDEEMRSFANIAPFDAEPRIMEWAQKAQELRELLWAATLNLVHVRARLEHERSQWRKEEEGFSAMLNIIAAAPQED